MAWVRTQVLPGLAYRYMQQLAGNQWDAEEGRRERELREGGGKEEGRMEAFKEVKEGWGFLKDGAGGTMELVGDNGEWGRAGVERASGEQGEGQGPQWGW